MSRPHRYPRRHPGWILLAVAAVCCHAAEVADLRRWRSLECIRSRRAPRPNATAFRNPRRPAAAGLLFSFTMASHKAGATAISSSPCC